MLYISGAVTGVKNYKVLFRTAETKLMRAGYEVLNPIVLCQDDWSWKMCMKRVLKAMLDCDALALLDNWEQSKGANIEVSLARQLEMPIKMLGEWC